MNTYNKISKDLRRITPVDPVIIPDPYDPKLMFKENVKREYHRLLQSIRSSDRITSLVNAYYLGKMTEVRANTKERTMSKKIITKHYGDICRRIFLLFEPLGVEQIYRTKDFKLSYMRMDFAPFSELREKAIQESIMRFSI